MEIANSSQDLSSTLPPVEDEHPVIVRFSGVMNELLSYNLAQGKSARSRRVTLVLEAVMEEVTEELREAIMEAEADGDSSFAGYFSWVGEIISWIGTGDIDSLPEEMQAVARRIMGIPEQKELTAG